MYQIIYDFISNHLIGAVDDYYGLTDVYCKQLATILTHVSIILLYVVAVLFIIWIFKLLAGLIRW